MANVVGQQNIIQQAEVQFDRPATEDNLGRQSESIAFDYFREAQAFRWRLNGNFGAFGPQIDDIDGGLDFPWRLQLYAFAFQLKTAPVAGGTNCTIQVDVEGTSIFSVQPVITDAASNNASGATRRTRETGAVDTFGGGSGITLPVLDPANLIVEPFEKINLSVNATDVSVADLSCSLWAYRIND